MGGQDTINFRYADDTGLMAESDEIVKKQLNAVDTESEKQYAW